MRSPYLPPKLPKDIKDPTTRNTDAFRKNAPKVEANRAKLERNGTYLNKTTKDV